MYSTTLTSSYFENFQNKISSPPCYPMDIINYRFTDDTYPMVDSTCLISESPISLTITKDNHEQIVFLT